MINGVNFGAISTDPTIKLQDATITQSNANNTGTPAAAQKVEGDSFAGGEKKKTHKGAKFLAFMAALGAGIAGIAVAAKKGKLGNLAEKLEGKPDFLKNGVAKLETFGNFIADKAAPIIAKVKDMIPGLKKAAEETTETVGEAVKDVAEAAT
ncbi:MAG: hypothetical protein PHV37_08145 [Candidatus Gastranaerophilales bacterium]|nr:hypothetical protein [Candidatus Gastranaerophilales bacterium]